FGRFFDGREWIEPMDEINIDVIRRKTTKTSFHGIQDVTPRESLMQERLAAAETDFRGNDHVVPARAQGLRKKFLRLPTGIYIGRIEMIDAGVQGSRHELRGQLLIDL